MADQVVTTRPPDTQAGLTPHPTLASVGAGGGEGEAYPDPGESVFESLILSMVHWWTLSGMLPNVVSDMVEKHFTQEQMITAHSSLDREGRAPKHHVSGNRSAGKAQAESLCKLVAKLNKENQLPRFTVCCEDLGRVSTMVSSLSLRDEQGVSARLESLELCMRRLQDTVVSTRQQPPSTAGTRPGRRGIFAGDQVQVNAPPSLPNVVITHEAPSNHSDQTFASVAASQTVRNSRMVNHGLTLSPQGEVEVRGRSPSPLTLSQKRGRDEEWTNVVKSGQRKIKKTVRKTEVGTSSVELTGIGAAGQLVLCSSTLVTHIGNPMKKLLKLF